MCIVVKKLMATSDTAALSCRSALLPTSEFSTQSQDLLKAFALLRSLPCGCSKCLSGALVCLWLLKGCLTCEEGHSAGKRELHGVNSVIVLKYSCHCLIWQELQMSNSSLMDLLMDSEDGYCKVGFSNL